MNPSTRIVVADAGPLIALARLKLLDRLPRLFEQTLVPRTVLQECGAQERIVVEQQAGKFAFRISTLPAE